MAYSKQTWDTTSYVNPTRMNHIEDGIANVNKWTLIASDITNSSSAVNVSNYGELWIVPKLQGSAKSAPLYTINLNTFNMGNSYREGTNYALDYIIRVSSNSLTLDYALTGWTSVTFDIYGR